MKDGKEAVKSDGRIIISSADGTLRINPVLATDDGKYDCRIKMTSAWGNDFNVKGEFQLKVLSTYIHCVFFIYFCRADWVNKTVEKTRI